MLNILDDFYLNQEEPNRSCLLALRTIILSQDQNVSETLKWGMPCFSYNKKIFTYLSIDRKTDEPYILMVEGKYLDFPELERGNRTRMKILRVDPNKDLSLETIEMLLTEALNLHRNGIINK